MERLCRNRIRASTCPSNSQHTLSGCSTNYIKAFFTDMLKKFGVKEVKVQEVVSLDDELLAYLP